MAVVPNNKIILWFGTNASIPSGYVRETSLDDKTVKGVPSGGSVNTSGGASTHTHTSPSHSHTLNAHTHTYQLADCLGSLSTGATGSGNNVLACEHYHTGTSGAINGGTTNGTAVTYAAVSNWPAYVEAIFIKAVGNQPVPSNASVLWTSSSIPTGFSAHDGTATPDCRSKYIKGATTSGNGGGTGGSETNAHDISHTHTTNTHTHVSATSSGVLSGCEREGGGTPVAGLNSTHTHTVTLDTGTEPISAQSGTITCSETVRPGFKNLNIIKNSSGGNLNTLNIIVMSLDSVVPSGTFICDGSNGTPDMRDAYIRMGSSTSDVLTTGGNHTHNHAAISHSHSSSGGHSHTTATISAHVPDRCSQGSGSVYDQGQHSITLASCSTSTPGYASATTTGDTTNNEPPHRTIYFLQIQRQIGGAVGLKKLLSSV